MKFFVSYFNHNDFLGCGDHLVYLRNGLSQAGRSAAITKDLVVDKDSINILLEFFSPAHATLLAQAHRERGLRFALVVSEVVTGRTFNDFGTGPAASHYGERAYWQTRFDCFMHVAPFAEAIWCLSDYQLAGYRGLLPGKRIETLPLCFDVVDAQSESGNAPERDINIVFFGNVTPYRQAALDALPVPIYVAKQLPRPVLADAIRRSRIALHLSLFAEWPYTSSIRHHVLLCRGSYVLSEASKLPGELDAFIDICPRAALADRVRELLARSDLPELATQAQARYAAERPIGPAFASLIARSFGSETQGLNV